MLDLEQSQAAAAVGQISLAHAYQEQFRSRGLTAAQIQKITCDNAVEFYGLRNR